MDKKIIATIYYNKKTKTYKAITSSGKNVTKDINNLNKLRYAHKNKRVIIGILNNKEIQWKTKKINMVEDSGYDWRTREEKEEALQREINKTSTKFYNRK